MRIVVEEMPTTCYDCEYFIYKNHSDKYFRCGYNDGYNDECNRRCSCVDKDENSINPQLHCERFVGFREAYEDLVREFFGDK